jgi:hypothetical protein
MVPFHAISNECIKEFRNEILHFLTQQLSLFFRYSDGAKVAPNKVHFVSHALLLLPNETALRAVIYNTMYFIWWLKTCIYIEYILLDNSFTNIIYGGELLFFIEQLRILDNGNISKLTMNQYSDIKLLVMKWNEKQKIPDCQNRSNNKKYKNKKLIFWFSKFNKSKQFNIERMIYEEVV